MSTETVAPSHRHARVLIQMTNGREFRVGPCPGHGAERLAQHLLEDAPGGTFRSLRVEPLDDLDRARGAIWGSLIGTGLWAAGVGLALGVILLLSGCATPPCTVSSPESIAATNKLIDDWIAGVQADIPNLKALIEGSSSRCGGAR